MAARTYATQSYPKPYRWDEFQPERRAKLRREQDREMVNAEGHRSLAVVAMVFVGVLVFCAGLLTPPALAWIRKFIG